MDAIREGRHLAAIMFVDMVGYTARMQENEPHAIAEVRGLWDLVRPIVTEHGGREVDLAGDGMLMEFPGVLSAVRCGLRIHEALHERNRALRAADRLRTRAGVHLGDIEHRDGRIYGDGVNIAARIIGLSPPGAIAMSAHVRDQLVNVLEPAPQRLGSKTLKNIKAPLEIWCLAGPDCTAAELAAARAAAQDESADRRWRFGAAVLDERTLELSVDGKAVELEKKILDLLTFLLHHAGEVVTKDEILAAVWPGRVVSESVLTKAVAKLREALGDQAQEIVRTAHGFGYRLAIPVQVDTVEPPAAPHFEFKPGDHPPQRPLWSLAQNLGQGGHGEVWLARHDKTREERVYKFALEAAHLASLKREITLSRVLNDSLGERDCFARVLDWNLEQLPYFIECEHVGSGSLVDWARTEGGLHKIPLATRLDIAAQVADALAAAHSVGVLHKDLKPSNILIARRNPGSGEVPALGRSGATPRPPYRIKLCDFGSGGVLDPHRLAEMGITRMGFTRTVIDAADGTSGTPLYLAPEILGGQPATSLADIYALGVVLYQLVVGDLQRTLAPGWEKDVPDELLREDIAAAASGDPVRRLADASLLSQRLRSLAARREQREAERAAQLKAEKQQQAAQRFRVRVWWTTGLTALFGIGAIAAFAMLLRTGWVADLATDDLDIIATQMEERGELREAEILRRKIVGYFEWLGRFHPIRSSGLHYRDHLALLLTRQGKRAEAEEQFKILLSETIDDFGIDDPHYAIFSSNYGEFLIVNGRHAQARELVEKAQPVLIQARQEGHPCVRFMVRRNTERLRRVYQSLGRKDLEAALPPRPSDAVLERSGAVPELGVID